MENYSHQSYPDSGYSPSSPLSREIDCENPASSWVDEPPSTTLPNYKVKFMCSYGGNIQPRSHDNSLSYVGGDTKILSVERNTTFSAVFAKLSSICDVASTSEISFKYQLPGEDLDALISVTNDEDLEHLMLEYDRLNRTSPKPAKLRIFLLTVNSKPNSEEYQFKEIPKPEGSWFVDALNSVKYRTSENSSPPPPLANPEPSNPDFLFGFDKATNYKVSDPNPNSANDVSHMNNQVGDGEVEMQKSYIEVNPSVNTSQMYQSEYYMVQEKASPAPMSVGYWPERQQPVYVIQTPSGGVYHQNPSVRPDTAQAYYSVQQPAYNAVPIPSPSLIQQNRVSGMQEGIGMLRQQPQVSYVDSSGRPVYYSIAGGGLAPAMQYQMVRTEAGKGMGFDAKVSGGNAPQTSSV